MKKLIKKKYNLNVTDLLILLGFVFVLGGLFGFIYETIFYKIDLGYFVKRGSALGPWVPIYGFGAIFIMLLAYPFHKKPALVFLISTIVCGLLEFITGYILLNVFDLRLWNYNVEIWNYGNIGGYICLRSVIFFGLSGVLLINVVVPILKKIINKLSKKALLVISASLSFIFLTDIISYAAVKPDYNDELSPLITSKEWYEEKGSGIIYFTKEGDFGYYCDCGSPVDDYDLCDSYKYSKGRNTIKLNCEEPGIINNLKILEVNNDKLVLDFSGEKRIFISEKD